MAVNYLCVAEQGQPPAVLLAHEVCLGFRHHMQSSSARLWQGMQHSCTAAYMRSCHLGKGIDIGVSAPAHGDQLVRVKDGGVIQVLCEAVVHQTPHLRTELVHGHGGCHWSLIGALRNNTSSPTSPLFAKYH